MPTSRTRDGKKVWIGRITIKGRVFEKSGLTSKKDAVAWEASKRLQLNGCSNLKREKSGTTLISLLTSHIDALRAQGKSDSYIADHDLVYGRVLEKLNPAARVEDMRYLTVQQYLDSVALEISPNRANIYRKYLLSAWSWGRRPFGLPKECPWETDRYKVDKGKKYVPPVEDFWKVVESATETMGRILQAILYTGARKSEIFRLRWEDVDFERKAITLYTRKRTGGGMEGDTIPMAAPLIAILKEQRFKTAFHDHVFLSYRKRPYTHATKTMERLCEKAGVKHFGFHAVRHLTASVLAEHKTPLIHIQKTLRHKDISTTDKYIHSLGFAGYDLDDAFQSVEAKREPPTRRAL